MNNVITSKRNSLSPQHILLLLFIHCIGPSVDFFLNQTIMLKLGNCMGVYQPMNYVVQKENTTMKTIGTYQDLWKFFNMYFC